MPVLARKARLRARLPVFAAWVFLLLPMGAAPAQEQPNPFRFLRPWLERQLGRSEAPRPEAAPKPSAEGAEADVSEGRSEADPPEPEAAEIEADNPAPPAGLAAEASTEDVSATGAAEPPGNVDDEGSSAASEGAPDGQAPAAGERVIGTLPPLRGGQSAAERQPVVPSPSGGSRKEAPQPLRLAALAGSDPGAMIRDLAPLTDALRRAAGRPVEILPVASYGAMIDAQVERRIDGGFYSAAAFAVAEAECRCLEPIVAPASADGTAAYYAIIVARPDSGIRSAADLAGRTIATGAADSVGARRMQLAGLMAEGIDPSGFGGVFTVGSAEEAVELVVQGAVDAAFAWSSLSGDAASGYSRGTLADLVGRGEIGARDVSIVWRSPPIAHAPLAVLRSLPDVEKEALESLLLGLERSEPAAYDRLNPYYGGGYVAVEPGDYSGLAAIAAQDVDALRLPETGAAGSADADAP